MQFEQRGQSLRAYDVCDYTSILCEHHNYAPTNNGHFLTCAQSKTVDNYALRLEVDGADSATSACKDWAFWYKNVISFDPGFLGIQLINVFLVDAFKGVTSIWTATPFKNMIL